ncbi:sodium:solute symporter family protein [Flavitalea sp. BT771]|uniref:sodium:solute symporter family protein n=1 Tax=Flavitalea sp. BT771 TaxID=3063329 RepID=UPI0026E378D0|nr:sodium:solute symporter family protein [Flavitalea sp. BT771]MDO6435645.1 sodium:solute symporter family protein [Flavitalea sp. BT771]MDV6224546.1 sodium:solute symporter family protein [Flavitalea sp. BT771]
MGKLDLIVMVVFGVMIFAIGLVFTRAGSKSGQAFFEAGGETPWWINGLSLFISYFSAGTFVVWGSIAYKQGLVANSIQLTMAVSGILTALFIAGKWKKTGAKTAAEFIGKRFNTGTQQFYTYLILLLSLFNTGAVLYPVGKMVSAATPLSLNMCIVIIGVIIVLYTAAGGLWAVLVTDVVQFVVLLAAVLIVVPAAFKEVGGVAGFVGNAPPDFFHFFSQDYTLGFMLAFVIYQTVYIGGNWSYVQRYTSVASERNAKKVAYLFGALYLVSPVIWMLPPMIFRVIHPGLTGLQPENAYMLLCQRVLPAGLIGLVLSGMVSATSSKANTTINLAATVFAKDVYLKLLRPAASEKEQILVGRLFTLVFGVCTILVAMVIPQAGGIVEVVLSIASIAGSALFAPVIWSLYSRRQTAFSVVTVTVVALSINMFFKFISPWMLGFKLSRTWETVWGVGIPLVLLGFFEVALRGGVRYSGFEADKVLASDKNLEAHKEADRQNKFGVAVIGWAIGFTGAGILLLGVLSSGGAIVCWVGGGIALSGLYILRLAGRYGRVR